MLNGGSGFMRKRMSPVTKYKLQLIIIYLAAIVFCILWLSNVIAINDRAKKDKMLILDHAEKAANSLQLYAQKDDEVLWNECVERVGNFSTTFDDDITVRSYSTRKTRIKNPPSSNEYMVSSYFRKIYRQMLSDPETVKPYAADLSWTMRSFGNKDPFSDENLQPVNDKLLEICAALGIE